MKTQVKFTVDTVAGNKPVKAGDIATLPHMEARYLVNLKKAALYEGEPVKPKRKREKEK